MVTVTAANACLVTQIISMMLSTGAYPRSVAPPHAIALKIANRVGSAKALIVTGSRMSAPGFETGALPALICDSGMLQIIGSGSP